MQLPTRRKAMLLIATVALLLIAVYGITSFTTTGGRPVSPLDDAYIHFQYARQLALGEPWRYNSGSPLSTGATSLLYPFLLAAGYIAGFQSDQIVWVAFLIGGISLLVSALLVYRITLELLTSMGFDDDPPLQITAVSGALLFLLNGAVQWTFFNGLESGIFTLFILASLDAALNNSLWRMALFLTITSLLRPEGLFLAIVAWFVFISWQLLTDHRRLKHIFWPLSTAVLLSAAPYFVNLALTGTPVATGAQAKSWLGNVPFRLNDIIGSMFLMARDITLRLSAGMLAPKPWPVVPLVLPLALAGAIGIWRRGDRRSLLLIAGWVLTGIAAAATLISAIWQVGRYQVPFLSLLIPLTMVGIFTLLRLINEPWRRPIAAVSLIILLAMALFSTYQAQQRYRYDLDSIHKQQVALGDWIRKQLPQDARIAVHDAGAIRYVGERPIHDLIGLTTQDAATAWRHGSGSQFELMEQADRRPDYFATYPNVHSIPYFAATDLFAEQLFATEAYPRLTAGTAGPLQVIYKADWRLANSGDTLHQSNMRQLTAGLPLITAIDLADLQDEKEKGLTWSEGAILSGFPTEVRQYRYRTAEAEEVIDGGRLVTGQVAFPVQAQAGLPLILIARVHPVAAGSVRVFVDGQDAGLWRYPAAPGQWLETAFVVPADLVNQDNPQIELNIEDKKPQHAFPPYYIWIWQGEPVHTAVNPQIDKLFQFGDGLTLLGYDLDLSNPRTGQTIPLTLYWQTSFPQDVDAKLFIHLYDASGDIVAQVDQRPYYDTQPPYAWIPDIPVTDPVLFELPPDLPSGSYTMAAGLYNPLTGQRYPVFGNPAQLLPESRILLGEFTLP